MRGFRIPRIKTIPSEWLLELIQRHIDIEYEGFTNEDVIRILTTMNPTEESMWLLQTFPNFDITPRGLYYRGLKSTDYDIRRELFKSAFVGGYTPDDLYDLAAQNDDDFDLVHWIKAAEFGNIEAMNHLIDIYENNFEAVKWTARRALLDFQNISTNADLSDLQVMFVIGSEMEGYQDIWGTHMKLGEQASNCVDFYLDTVHRARVAALYAVWGLPIVRDVAKIIGRLIYATRGDVYLWNGQRAVVCRTLSGPE
jgi:hypothetical protein